MNLLLNHEIKELILQTDGFEVQKETDKGIEVYDKEEDKFITYRYLENLDIEEVFQFNSLTVNKKAFFSVVQDCIDKNMLMTVEKVVFINNEKEYEELIEAYPEQSMDLKENVGINFYMDNVVVINAMLIKALSKETTVTDDTFSYEDEITLGLWQTLIHELRHTITGNPIIPEDFIPIEEGDEDKVEEYCRKVFEEKIEKHPDYLCF